MWKKSTEMESVGKNLEIPETNRAKDLKFGLALTKLIYNWNVFSSLAYLDFN